MNVPAFTNSKVVDEEGYFTPEWSNLMNTLISQVQLNLGNEGYVVPQQAAVDIAKLTDAEKSTGAIVYDSTNNALMGNINGVWKTFTLT